MIEISSKALQIFEKVFNYRRTINKNHNRNYSPCLWVFSWIYNQKDYRRKELSAVRSRRLNPDLRCGTQVETIKESPSKRKKKPTGSEAKPSARYANEIELSKAEDG